MRRDRDFRNDFSAGVVSPEFLERDRSELTARALLRGDNVIVTDAGTALRRPGTVRLSRPARGERVWVVDLKSGETNILVFSAGFVDVYSPAGALVASRAGPWGANDLFTMSLVNQEDGLSVWSASFPPQSIQAAGGAWTVAAFQFRVDSINRSAAPFYRFGLAGVSMSIAAYAGTNIVINFSAAVLTPQHVGVRFLYANCQVILTSYISPTEGRVTIVDALYPTLRVGIVNAAAFKVGDLCEGDVTNVRGQIVAIGAGVVDIVLTEGYTQFLAQTSEAPGEKLISVEASETITTVTGLGTPGPTNIWFEELISPARGYPRTAAMHKGRLCIAGFPLVGSLLATSALNAYDDFSLGGGTDRDAILEEIGEDPDAKILHLVSTEQLVILTDRGSWYVPEGADRRFTPGGIGFNPISPDASSTVVPAWTPEGVVFYDTKGRVILLSLTGTQRGAWSPTELSTLGFSLLKGVKQLVYSTGFAGRQERVIVAINSDGTAASFTYRRGADQAGWFPWSRRTGYSYLSFAAFNGDLFCLAGGLHRLLERFDASAVIDSEFLPAVTTFTSEALHVLWMKHVRGEASTNGSGVHDWDAEIDRLGHDFPVRIEPAPLIVAQAGRARRRNGRTYVSVLDSGLFRINGLDRPGYLFDSDMETPPPVRSREEQATQQGSGVMRTSSIEQLEGEGAPLHVRSVTYEVVSMR